MSTPERDLLSQTERALRERYDKDEADRSRVPSTATGRAPSERLDQLTLPDEMRGRMPFTKDKYQVKENPQLVQWEREVRKFLRNLTPRSGHRVAAIMVYEWCTGIKVADLMADGGSAGADLRKLNQILDFYFGGYGKPYKTWIAGRQVLKCYRVPSGYYIRRHRPMTLTLYLEYLEKSLYP